jgi:vacuolar iron transporter family protein
MQAGNPKPRKNIRQILAALRIHQVSVKKYNPEAVKAAADQHARERIEQATRQSGATGQSEYLGNLVYGALDGIITTFAIASGVVGANLSPGIILVLGLANLLGDGFSMATGAYLSARSEQEVYERERQHAAERIARAPEKEREALLALYQEQNYPEGDAQQLVDIISREPGRWVGTMMIEKLLLLPQKRKPTIEGLATFIAFLLAGSIPLLIYGIDLVFKLELPSATAFTISIVLSGLALTGVGAAKVWITGRNALRSGFEMLIVGGLAAAVAYSVGALLKTIGNL